MKTQREQPPMETAPELTQPAELTEAVRQIAAVSWTERSVKAVVDDVFVTIVQTTDRNEVRRTELEIESAQISEVERGSGLSGDIARVELNDSRFVRSLARALLQLTTDADATRMLESIPNTENKA